MEWHNFTIYETSDGLPEDMMLFTENGSLHHRQSPASS
jgi:hypothetical protein